MDLVDFNYNCNMKSSHSGIKINKKQMKQTVHKKRINYSNPSYLSSHRCCC